MTEEFLHYIWKHQLFKKEALLSVNNDSVEIISTGTLNHDAGPDFTNARIKINETIWAGNIEIHIDSSSWQTHKHQKNKAYSNVILHVVANYTKPAFDTNNREVPTLLLNFDNELLSSYNRLNTSKLKIACSNDLHLTDEFIWKMWLDRLCIERLESKTKYIKSLLEQNKRNWEESFYTILARSFGFKTNADPFEILARLTPIKLVTKYSRNLLHIEALLLGQAGFLNDDMIDEYSQQLKKEYFYLKKIHKLKSVEKHIWKFMRLRPGNFPTIRIAQFASLINNSSRLFSKILETENVNELHQLFSCNVSDYWNKHYTFGKETVTKPKRLGKISINGIIINTIIPFLFIYGKESGNESLCTKALKLLDSMPPEKNSIISNWAQNNVPAKSAAQSQALIQLTNTYCTEKKCLYCQIGNSIIQRRN